MRARVCFPILMSILLLPIGGSALQKKLKPYVDVQMDLAAEESEIVELETQTDEEPVCCEPEPKWYLAFQPGYYYFTNHMMREFFNRGQFTGRVELGYKAWRPLHIWLDGGYFQKNGKAIGGDETTRIKLATITLGLKTIFFVNHWLALYLGAGPRVFMLMMHNDSPYVPATDNAIGVGGGFDGGIWILPFRNKNIFFNLFADYSLKTLKIEEDEMSSTDHDINVSGITGGAGIGFRF